MELTEAEKVHIVAGLLYQYKNSPEKDREEIKQLTIKVLQWYRQSQTSINKQ